MIDSKIIVIVDDHVITRRGMVEVLLDAIKDIDIHEFDTEESGLAFIQKNNSINLIIADLQLSLSAKSFCIPQLAKKIKVPYIIYSSFDNKIFIEEALKNNALGYICKRSESSQLIEGGTKALNGEKFICPIATASLERENLYWTPKPLSLSPSEKQLLKLYAMGMNSKSIIKKLKITENTLRSHRRHILARNSCNFEQAMFSYNEWFGTNDTE